MVTIQLEPADERRLEELAQSQAKRASDLARDILEDYLRFHTLPQDSEDAWAEASLALIPEVFQDEDWAE